MHPAATAATAALLAALPGAMPAAAHPAPRTIDLGPAEVTLPDGRRIAAQRHRLWKPTCLNGRPRPFDPAAMEARIAARGEPAAVVVGNSPLRSGINLVFNLFEDVNPQNTAGIQAVADYYAGVIADPVTVTIDVFFSPSSFGGTGAEFLVVDYEAWRQALLADADPDDTVEALLPVGGLPARYAFAGPVTIEQEIAITVANARAVAIEPGITIDAAIFVGSELDWDPADGIGQPGQFGEYSGQDIMAHEVGHALGFVNVVEFGADIPSSLDAYRFAGFGPSTPQTDAEFTAFPRALYIGSLEPAQQHLLDVRRATYLMSNASEFQASHFRETNFTDITIEPIGRMEPAIARFETSVPDLLFQSDLRALDAIGWDIAGTATCPADLTGDGVLSLDDLDAFAQAFFAGSLLADCDASGDLNLDDLDCFIAAFIAGCP